MPYQNHIHIDMVAGVNPGGPGFVGGAVSQGANKTGDPISDINVMIFDAQNNPLAYVYSDNTGSFEIGNLPLGELIIYPEAPGKITSPLTVTLTQEKNSEDQVLVTVNSATITVDLASGVDHELTSSALRVFPNPVQGVLNIEPLKGFTSSATATLTDASGKVVTEFELVPNNLFQLNTSSYPNGIYILTIRSENGMETLKIVK
jgi:hypothetical protein